MNLAKKILCVFAACAVSSFALAATSKDSVINLTVPNNGVVNPNGGTLAVPLSSLITGVTYNVTCHVNDPNLPSPIAFKLALNGLTTSTSASYSVNGVTTNSYGQANLSAADNIATAQNVIYVPQTGVTATFNFQNLDTTATANVSNCSATPVTTKG